MIPFFNSLGPYCKIKECLNPATHDVTYRIEGELLEGRVCTVHLHILDELFIKGLELEAQRAAENKK